MDLRNFAGWYAEGDSSPDLRQQTQRSSSGLKYAIWVRIAKGVHRDERLGSAPSRCKERAGHCETGGPAKFSLWEVIEPIAASKHCVLGKLVSYAHARLYVISVRIERLLGLTVNAGEQQTALKVR